MGYLIKQPNEVVTFKRTLNPSDILSVGNSLFRRLNIPVSPQGTSYFLPINFLFVFVSGTTPYDFPPNSHPCIIYNATQQYCFLGKELINNWHTLFFANCTSRIHNLSGTDYTTEPPMVTPFISSQPDLFFGVTGANANFGDYVYNIYITGSYINL